MNQRQRPDRLRDELRKRGLPLDYAARLIEELADHFTDIQKENPSMDAHLSAEERLGSPQLLASTAQRELAGRTFAGRHPILTFLIGPIPVVALAWYATVVGCARCKAYVTPMVPATITPPTIFEWILTYGCLYVSRFFPFRLTAWLFTRLGRRAGRPTWGLAACGIVAYFAFTFLMMVRPPSEQYNLSLWFSFVLGLEYWRDRLLQAAAPLLLGLWTWWQTTRRAQSTPWRPVTEHSAAASHA